MKPLGIGGSVVIYSSFALSALTLSLNTQALPKGRLDIPAEAVVCYVQAGAVGDGDGSKALPYGSLAEVEDDQSCTVILIKTPKEDDLALDGGIRLRDGQKLFGLGAPVTRPANLPPRRALITNTNEEDEDFFGRANFGSGVILANDNEVAGIHIDSTHNAGIWLANGYGAHIHDVLITNANTSADIVDSAIGLSFPSASIVIAAGFTEEEGVVYLGPSSDTSALVENSILRGGQRGIQQWAVSQDADLEVAGVKIERLSTESSPFTKDYEPLPDTDAYQQAVAGLDSLGLGGLTKVTIRDSKFLEVDNIGNVSAVVSVRSANGVAELNMTSSIIKNASPLSEIDPNLPTGDGVILSLIGGQGRYALDDVTITKSGQDAFEVAMVDEFRPNRPGEINGTLDRVRIKDPGRWGVVPYLLNVSGDAPTATIGLQMTNSLIKGAGAGGWWVDYDGLVGAVWVIQENTVPGGQVAAPGHSYDIDLGSFADGTGSNRIVNNAGMDIYIENIGTANEPLILDAQLNWWGKSDGPDPERIGQSDSSNATVSVTPFLVQSPAR